MILQSSVVKFKNWNIFFRLLLHDLDDPLSNIILSTNSSAEDHCLSFFLGSGLNLIPLSVFKLLL